MNNKQKIIITSAAVLLVIIIVAGYFYWSAAKKSQEAANALQGASNAVEQVVEKATQGALPSLSANPMENKPDLNPVDKANPIKDIKINPFD
ncbi:MAG: hypothetical protein AAB842_03240 [Patescibacteria group bacterium]